MFNDAEGYDAQQAPSLVALCASHITTPERMDQLQWMLRSWAGQTFAVDMYISLSFGDEWSAQAQEETVAQLHERFPGLTILAHPAPLTQGEHYKALVNWDKLASLDADNTWVMFTDDDDAWHMERAATYAAALRRAQQGDRLARTLAVYCGKIRQREGAFTPSSEHCVLPWEADQQLGQLMSDRDEYWAYVMRLSSAAWFLANCSPAVLEHKYWDLCFAKFLGKGHSYLIERAQPSRGCWMYLYTKGAAQSVTGNIRIRHAEQAQRQDVSPEARARRQVEAMLPELCATTHGDVLSIPDEFNWRYAYLCAPTSVEFLNGSKTPQTSTMSASEAVFLVGLMQQSRKLACPILEDASSIPHQLMNSPRAQQLPAVRKSNNTDPSIRKQKGREAVTKQRVNKAEALCRGLGRGTE
jgi:hypothetical protein